jgi:hypothetical protein
MIIGAYVMDYRMTQNRKNSVIQKESEAYSVKTGIMVGTKVQTSSNIHAATNPHRDTGIVKQVCPDYFIVEFTELGEQEVKLEEIEVVK